MNFIICQIAYFTVKKPERNSSRYKQPCGAQGEELEISYKTTKKNDNYISKYIKERQIH